MLRPVNLQTDLAPLADLIELAFAETMDSSGRAALREMRMMSRMGAGIGLLSKFNDMTVGISKGVVWVEGGQLVGNVSIYPARLPTEVGPAWIIANVGVHPMFQRRGIARRLMLGALDTIRGLGGHLALLQVDEDNLAALRLYQSLGFVTEAPFTTYKRLPSLRLPHDPDDDRDPVYIRRRRRSEWQSEMALALRFRPTERGGMGWLRPVMPSLFRPSLRRALADLVSFRQFDRYVSLPVGGERLQAAMWVERMFGLSTRLTLLLNPVNAETHATALLTSAVRQFGNGALILEHPAHDSALAPVLDRFRFMPQRTVIHMHWRAGGTTATPNASQDVE